MKSLESHQNKRRDQQKEARWYSGLVGGHGFCSSSSSASSFNSAGNQSETVHQQNLCD